MSNSSAKSIEVFFSYSHADTGLRDELETHLSILKRQGVISAWHDRQIPAGTEWPKVLDERLNAAQIILLLVSADFLASNYCYEIEMKRALERHGDKEDKAVVIPIILRDCLWEDAPFSHLQAVPKNVAQKIEPVSEWKNRDGAFTEIARRIRQVIRENFSEASSSQTVAAPGRAQRGEMVPLLCDRTPQEESFDAFLHHQSAQVLCCVVRGEPSECPANFSKRLTATIIEDYAKERWGAQGICPAKMIPWPEPGRPADKRQEGLVTRIYGAFERRGRDASAHAFVRAFAGKPEKMIVLRHTIYAERWDAEQELLRGYLRFWDEVNALQPEQQFVVFLNLLYPSRPSGFLARFRRARFDREDFDRQLSAFFNDDNAASPALAPRLLLDELGCITPEHVNDWFDQHNLLDERERQREIAALFKKSKCLPMMDIEGELRRLHSDALKSAR